MNRPKPVPLELGEIKVATPQEAIKIIALCKVIAIETTLGKYVTISKRESYKLLRTLPANVTTVQLRRSFHPVHRLSLKAV